MVEHTTTQTLINHELLLLSLPIITVRGHSEQIGSNISKSAFKRLFQTMKIDKIITNVYDFDKTKMHLVNLGIELHEMQNLYE